MGGACFRRVGVDWNSCNVNFNLREGGRGRERGEERGREEGKEGGDGEGGEREREGREVHVGRLRESLDSKRRENEYTIPSLLNH